MKRHEALKTLSSDHHQGLVWSRKLRQIPSEIPSQQLNRILTEFMQVWTSEIQPHFREEEDVLLPLFALDGDFRADPVRQMLEQHIEIRRDVYLLQQQPDIEMAMLLGELLQSHIRLEEGEVFPLIENQCSDKTLQLIASEIASG